jgi:phosphate transport system substrate-binding protein
VIIGDIRWWRRKLQRGALILFLALLAACTPTVEPPSPAHLKMAGSTSMQALVEELVEAYTSQQTHVSFDIDARGSRLGLEALRDGTVDIALLSRDLTVDEEEGLTAVVVAYDALAVLVNDQNSIESLTLGQVRDIFSGRTLLWSEVGGDETEIQVLSREDGSGTREAFERAVMGEDRVTAAAIVIPGSELVGWFVAEEPLTIGYTSSVGHSRGSFPLRIDGVRPGLQATAEGRYGLIRPFVLVTRESPDQEVKAFVDFVRGPAGQEIVGKRYGQAR